jgi:hypothetical protein
MASAAEDRLIRYPDLLVPEAAAALASKGTAALFEPGCNGAQ